MLLAYTDFLWLNFFTLTRIHTQLLKCYSTEPGKTEQFITEQPLSHAGMDGQCVCVYVLMRRGSLVR